MNCTNSRIQKNFAYFIVKSCFRTKLGKKSAKIIPTTLFYIVKGLHFIRKFIDFIFSSGRFLIPVSQAFACPHLLIFLAMLFLFSLFAILSYIAIISLPPVTAAAAAINISQIPKISHRIPGRFSACFSFNFGYFL